jgi:RES domain-containing protein
MIAYRMHRIGSAVFDTTGSFLFPGRWHFAGSRVVYAAEHASLAALETLIHASQRAVPNKAITEIQVPEDMSIESSEWMEIDKSQTFGRDWVGSGRTAILKVPSKAVNLMESNFLINPEHPDFARIRAGQTRDFAFDMRFFDL